MPDPIAFMVMPFDPKATGVTEKDVPAEVDFDALWERVYQPILEELGYQAVRADRDVGALIISEMIQRLAIADLVVADITLANANVYYEVGVRHAAKEKGCVLVGAEWARPVFDLAQMRQLRFPLADGTIGDDTAAAAKEKLTANVGPLIDGSSPVFDAVEGFPDSSASRASAFREQVAQLSRSTPTCVQRVSRPPISGARRRSRSLERHGRTRAIQEAVVLELLRLLRDLTTWKETLDYIDSLPPNVARHPLVLEQRALALAKYGDPAEAAGRLEELIETQGGAPERYGLVGGRYKELYRRATTELERAGISSSRSTRRARHAARPEQLLQRVEPRSPLPQAAASRATTSARPDAARHEACLQPRDRARDRGRVGSADAARLRVRPS